MRKLRWTKTKRVVAHVMIFFNLLKGKGNKIDITTEDIVRSRVVILKLLQERHHAREVGHLQIGQPVLVFRDGIPRVGGCLRRAALPQNEKHRVILPKKNYCKKSNRILSRKGS